MRIAVIDGWVDVLMDGLMDERGGGYVNEELSTVCGII